MILVDCAVYGMNILYTTKRGTVICERFNPVLCSWYVRTQFKNMIEARLAYSNSCDTLIHDDEEG